MSEYNQEVYDAVRSCFGEAGSYAAGAAFDSARPHAIMRPKISIDGNQWCALYGDNLQDGVAGFGDTPILAMLDFDKNWQSQKLPTKGTQP